MIEKETREMDAGKLLGEVVLLRKRIQELESSEAERRRLEEALRDSEERFAQFMHYLPGWADIKDSQGRFLTFNRRLCELVGRTEAERFKQKGGAFYEISQDSAG